MRPSRSGSGLGLERVGLARPGDDAALVSSGMPVARLFRGVAVPDAAALRRDLDGLGPVEIFGSGEDLSS